MQDTGLTVTVKTQGIPEAQRELERLNATMTKLTINQNGSVTATGRQASAFEAVDRATQRASRSQLDYFGHIARTTVQSALINKLFLEFVDVSGQAIKQVDLMNNFPVTMASMGQSTQEAAEAFQSLRTYVGNVGGDLADATSAVTRFTGVTNDVQAAVSIYQGLNNALVAGDSSLEEQRLAAVQFAQALERGKPDMREWLSLTQNMSNQLAIVAQSMGYVNANALGEALRSGEESMASFTTELTRLSTGTGPIAVQAMARMNGLQFAFNVMKNTLVQGVAEIVNAFGRSNIVSFFTFLTQVIRVLTSWVITLINWLGSLANMISRLFGGGDVFTKVVGDTAGVAQNIESGAGAADDLADGLGKGSKAAKEMNKSLASFDKMNVLADKTSGSGGGGGADGGGGGGGFDTGQLGDLGNIFDGIKPKLDEISNWAKLFAGILAGLAANKLFEKIFGINPLKEFGKALGTYVGKPLLNLAKTGAKVGAQLAKSIGLGLLGQGSGGSGVLGQAAALGARIGLAIRGGITAAMTPVGLILRTLIIGPLIAIGSAIAGVFVAAAAAIGIPVAALVAIVVVAVLAIIAVIWLIWTNWETIWGFIVGVFNAAWGWIVDQWNTLYGIFEGPVKFILQFIEATFILIVAIIAISLELIYNLVVGTVKLIYNVLAAIAGWINTNVIQPVWNFFKWLWDSIVAGVTAAWNWILNNVLFPVANWINVNVVQPISRFFKALWDSISGFVSGFVQKAFGFLSPFATWIKTNVIDKVFGFFQTLWRNLETGFQNIKNFIQTIFGSVAGFIKAPINGVIDVINGALRGMNKIKVPDWVPGLGGKGVNFPMIPRLAKGGFLDKATMAIMGESGEEAVIPMENNTEGLNKLADLLNERMGSGQPIELVVQIGEDKIVSKVVDLINEKTHMSGRNTIYV